MAGSVDIPAVERRNLTEQIAERIKSLILSGRFRPGERLPPERELAKVLRVTRSTLREAMKILETLKFVAIRQGDGVRVQDYLRAGNLDLIADLLISSGDVNRAVFQNIIEARAIFLVVLASLAAARATDELVDEYASTISELARHRDDRRAFQRAELACVDVLARASRNIVFVFVLNSIREVYLRHRDVFAGLYGSPQTVVQAHERILMALEQRDSALARKAALELASDAAEVARTFV